MPKWTGIIIHHSDTTDDAARQDWDGIRRFHMSWRLDGDTLTAEQLKQYQADLAALKGQAPPAGWKWTRVLRPWRDIGYNWGLESVKGKLVIQQGRPMDIPGAHCEGMNSVSLGICCVGDFDKERPSDAIYYNCAQLCANLIKRFPTIQVGKIEPHRKYANKTCPGNLFDMNRLLGYVRTMV